jgi:hypothetical protein
VALVFAVAAGACAAKATVSPSPPSPRDETIVLLRDDDTGVVGAADVSTARGSIILDREGDAVRVVSDAAPVALGVLGVDEIDEIFGDTLDTLPPPPERFVLRFRFESDELTDESRALVPTILDAVRARPVPDLVVVGHTDTAGAADANFKLGFLRATAARKLFVDAGLDPAAIDVFSHGERDLLVPTPDDTLEPQNRRVEIAVR